MQFVPVGNLRLEVVLSTIQELKELKNARQKEVTAQQQEVRALWNMARKRNLDIKHPTFLDLLLSNFDCYFQKDLIIILLMEPKDDRMSQIR